MKMPLFITREIHFDYLKMVFPLPGSIVSITWERRFDYLKPVF